MNAIDHDSARRRFSMPLEGGVGVLDYVLHGSTMTIMHTEVPPHLAGRGLAGELMRHALKVAHTAGWTVVPACSYAVSYMKRHAAE